LVVSFIERLSIILAKGSPVSSPSGYSFRSSIELSLGELAEASWTLHYHQTE
jgi:hypothetical protein